MVNHTLIKMIDFAIDSRLYLQKNIDLALQELDILFNTENTELIGYPDFGTNFEQFLWELVPSVESLQKYINQKIQTDTLFLKNMENDISIDVDDTEYGNNIYVVNIIIKDPEGNQIKRIYKLK